MIACSMQGKKFTRFMRRDLDDKKVERLPIELKQSNIIIENPLNLNSSQFTYVHE